MSNQQPPSGWRARHATPRAAGRGTKTGTTSTRWPTWNAGQGSRIKPSHLLLPRPHHFRVVNIEQRHGSVMSCQHLTVGVGHRSKDYLRGIRVLDHFGLIIQLGAARRQMAMQQLREHGPANIVEVHFDYQPFLLRLTRPAKPREHDHVRWTGRHAVE